MKSVTAVLNDDGTVDLIVKQGCTLRFAIVVKAQQQDGTYLPVDLTGYSAQCQVRKSVSSPDVTANFECTIPDGPSGRVECVMAADVCAGIHAGRSASESTYVYDVRVYRDVPEDVFRGIEGKFIVDPQVSKEVVLP